MGEAEVSAFLSHLAVDNRVAASTQNQALSALLFLYKHVLQQPFDWLDRVERANAGARTCRAYACRNRRRGLASSG